MDSIIAIGIVVVGVVIPMTCLTVYVFKDNDRRIDRNWADFEERWGDAKPLPKEFIEGVITQGENL